MHGWRNFRTFVSKYNADMAMNSRELELILINISGQDHPGVTSALSEILAKYDAGILDIGQRRIGKFKN